MTVLQRVIIHDIVQWFGAALGFVLPLSLSVWAGFNSAPGQMARRHDVGNDACATCHMTVYDRYSSTAMARSSGPAMPNVIEGSFSHSTSGVSYRIQRQREVALLSYDRSGPHPLHGTQRLKYYVGSNTRGRTFLFEIEGFLYQSPINYYTAKNTWDMSPGYSQLRRMELNHPVDSTCLFCHASRVQPRLNHSLNHFAGEAFLQPGVGCERCHGPGSDHVRGIGSMVNPAKLAEDRRDDVCVQCHLEGEARIATAGHTQDEYTPGERLSDYLAIFVRKDAATGHLGAVSQVEALAVSTCKRRSGSALSCLTCHDPHMQPDGAERTNYYRAKCVGCHASMAPDHHPEQQDCTACHMPGVNSADISHTMVTDHRILRTPQRDRKNVRVGALVEFGPREPRRRELGLAYGELALRGNEFAAHQARRLLEDELPRHKNDPDVLTRLGYLSQAADGAEELYVRALRADPSRAVVAANLGVLYARRGKLGAALELWRDAFAENPQLSDLGINLAKGLCAAGDESAARDVVRRILEHDPDSGPARALLASGCTGQ